MLKANKDTSLHSMFLLENCLLQHQSDKFIPLLKQFLSFSHSSKTQFTLNPGLTLYSPESTQNLSSKKSVLIFAHELSRTGAPVVAVDTAKTLARNGFFTVVVTMRRGPMLQDLLDIGIPVFYDQELASFNNYTKLANSSKNYFYVDTISDAFKYIFVITAVYYNLIRRFSNFHKNVFWWLHEGSHSYNIFGPHMPQRLSSTIKVYAGGVYAKDQLENYNFSSYNAKVLNYGITDTFSPPTPRKTHDGIIKFLLPGSITDRKNQQTLLEAIKRLPDSYREKAKFFFIGDITSQYDIDGIKIKSALLSATKTIPSIIYINSVSREKLYQIYQDIDVLVLTSLDDPMPVVATEALMLEKVVLCSNTTGTSYYLEDGENGFVFPSGDVHTLCSKIEFIIDHQTNLKPIGKKGRKIFQKHFDMKIFEKNLLHIMGETK